MINVLRAGKSTRSKSKSKSNLMDRPLTDANSKLSPNPSASVSTILKQTSPKVKQASQNGTSRQNRHDTLIPSDLSEAQLLSAERKLSRDYRASLISSQD